MKKQPRIYPPTARDFRLVDSLVNSPCDGTICDCLNHTDEDEHWGPPCPILIRIRAAWERIEAAGKPKARKVKK